MAYGNDQRDHRKHNEIKSRFNDDQYEAIVALAKLHRLERAVLIRMWVEEKLSSFIAQDSNGDQSAA
ncbi:hypothetical protein [Pseudomonas chlororaphis]|uniref:hypothetical protein n=1 Tax=Pseudomonas chlororaphis TaxID=587753 RepID=UPI0024081944|nr:hypothetical protein [Pseudomonas chlororaphis]